MRNIANLRKKSLNLFEVGSFDDESFIFGSSILFGTWFSTWLSETLKFDYEIFKISYK